MGNIKGLVEDIMKNIAIIIFSFGIIISSWSPVCANEILIKYQHSLRIQFSEIDIKIFEEKNGGCTLHVTTNQAGNEDGSKHNCKDQKIKIEQSYFNEIYERFLSLNFKEIIESNDSFIGVDGFVVEVTVGSNYYNVGLVAFSPDCDQGRNLCELTTILKDVFTKAGIIEYY